MTRSSLVAAAAATAVVACGGGGSNETPHFTLVSQNESASLLSVWGNSGSDVWVVGGAGSDGGPTVYHLQNGAWSAVDTGQTGIDLWWVFGFVGGDVFFSGSTGAILRYHDGAFTAMPTPATSGSGSAADSADTIVFGMWGAAPDDMWAAGRAGEGAGVILWHFDGTSWTAVPPPSALPAGDLAFKVNGQSTDDVWFSLSGGDTLHWTGSGFDYLQTPDPVSLFSIATTATDVVTVGDVAQSGYGGIYENSGSGWVTAPLQETLAWHGVAAGSDEVYVVGDDGAVALRDDAGTWAIIPQTLIQQTFHAAWVDPSGGMWGVGGEFAETPTLDGFLLYRGTESVPAITP